MRNLFATFSVVMLLMMSACSRETLIENDSKGVMPEAENVLRVYVNTMRTGNLLTRAEVDPEEDEDTIESLYLLFFESETDNSGEFVDYIEVESPAGSGLFNDINMHGTQIQVTDAYHILAVANIHGEFGSHYLNGEDVSAWMLQWAGKSESEVTSAAKMRTRTGMRPLAGQLLMSGRVEKPANCFEVNIPLIRNQVRFDVINNLKDQYDVVSVEIRNVYTETKVWNDGTSAGALDFSDNTSRIPLYYRFVNASDNPNYDEYEGDILGGLYAFENQVTMPERNDRYTTCLIVELQEKNASTSDFYRINIAPDESSQMLKPDNVYRVTIDNVGGRGEISADAAYDNPDNNQLDYTINAWDLNEIGFSETDGNSVLAGTHKSITLPRAEIIEGNPVVENSVSTSFQIYTFTSNPNPVTPLTITSQSYSSTDLGEDDYHIVASLDNNTLTITADPIPSGTTVRGEIRLGYAGLRATINVIQTDTNDDFLNLYLPDGGIPPFAPFGGISSGLLRVQASGDWTARLIAPNGGFSFAEGRGEESINSVSDDGTLISDNKFRVWTLNANEAAQVREAFIIVSLDKDSENYSKAVRIFQSVAAGIAIVPQHTVTFDGTGTLAAIPNNDDQTFTIRPSQTGTENPVFAAWDYEITGLNSDKFRVIDPHETTDVYYPGDNNLTVEATGINASGTSYTATLRVYLTNAPQTSASIELVQRSSSIDFTPNSLQEITARGGESDLVTVQADPSLQWELKSFVVSDGSPTKELFNHQVTLVDEEGAEIIQGEHYSVADDRFKVKFGKIYYPNRDIPVSVTVTIGIVGSQLEKSITVNQTALTSRTLNIVAPQTGGYGNIHGGSYNSFFLRGIKGMGTVSVTANAATNMFYRNYVGLYATYDWSVENNFRNTRDALMMLTCDAYDAAYISAINNVNSPFGISKGFTITQQSGLNASFNSSESDTKIYQLLVAGAASGILPINTGVNLTEDATSTQVVTYPETTVPIIVSEGSGRAFLAIDPKLNLIYLGESQLFDTAIGNEFLNNLLVYIKNASIYGSHFTELMVDGNELPAPWDEVWGANAGVAR
jgi:hypothetical protein